MALNNQLDLYKFFSDGLKDSLRQEYFNASFRFDALAQGKTDKLMVGGLINPQDQDLFKKASFLSQNSYFFEPNKAAAIKVIGVERNDVINPQAVMPKTCPKPSAMRNSRTAESVGFMIKLRSI